MDIVEIIVAQALISLAVPSFIVLVRAWIGLRRYETSMR
jgi:hypothetical protein